MRRTGSGFIGVTLDQVRVLVQESLQGDDFDSAAIQRLYRQVTFLGGVTANPGGVSTETLTLHIDERFLAFDQTGVYTTAVVLAILAVITLIAMNLMGRKERLRGDHHPAGDEALR